MFLCCSEWLWYNLLPIDGKACSSDSDATLRFLLHAWIGGTGTTTAPHVPKQVLGWANPQKKNKRTSARISIFRTPSGRISWLYYIILCYDRQTCIAKCFRIERTNANKNKQKTERSEKQKPTCNKSSLCFGPARPIIVGSHLRVNNWRWERPWIAIHWLANTEVQCWTWRQNTDPTFGHKWLRPSGSANWDIDVFGSLSGNNDRLERPKHEYKEWCWSMSKLPKYNTMVIWKWLLLFSAFSDLMSVL